MKPDVPAWVWWLTALVLVILWSAFVAISEWWNKP